MGEVATATTREQNVGYGQKNSTKEGPWMVVKKPQRSRKTPAENKEAGKIVEKEAPVIINEPAQAKGSRFAILSEDIPILEVNDNDSNDGQRITVNQGVTNNINKDGNNELDLIREENRENILNMPANNNKKFKNKRGNGGFDVKKGEQMIDRPPRDLKLATRGGNTFKGKVGVNVKKGVESYVDMLGVTNIESWTGQQKQDENLIGISNNGQNLGPKEIHHPNRPRPPNQVDIPHDTPLTSLNQPTDDLTLEGETFEDARDQGVHGNYDSDMDVTEALVRAGLESSNLIVVVDFTKSNEWTGTNSIQRQSLHHIASGLNPYEQAISIIGKTMADFDEDNMIPCFGFEDASTHDQDVFSFYPDVRFCNGLEDVLSRYREVVPHLRPAGPTSFAPVIEMAMTVVEQSGGQYHILVIITDGQVTRSVDT
ncbi:RING-type E3 ubiquitin transferase [Trifolium repens]|nr:RING-type E3 ubiquitin transferase [Trifolium repens]